MPTFWKHQQIPPRNKKLGWLSQDQEDLEYPLPRKKRISPKKTTGEKAMFEMVWLSRAHNCEICGQQIRVPRTWCFAHRLPKGTFPEHRLNPNNISLVCSLSCHQKVDAQRRERGKEWLDANNSKRLAKSKIAV